MNKKIILSFIFASLFISCNKTNNQVKEKKVVQKVIEKNSDKTVSEKKEIKEKDTSKILAMIGEQKITENDLKDELKSLPSQYKYYYETEEGKKQLLNRILEQKILKKEALKSGLNKEKDYLKELEAYKERLLASNYITKNIFGKVTVSQEELEQKYQQDKEKYKQEEQVTVSHILIKTQGLSEGEEKAAKIKAIEILNRALEGEDFAELAKHYSEGPSGPYGGSLGWFGKGKMVKPFEEAAFEAPKGKVYPKLVKTQFGYHIIKVEDKKEESYTPFEKVKDQMKEELLNKKRYDAYTKVINELKTQYDAKIIEPQKKDSEDKKIMENNEKESVKKSDEDKNNK